MAPDLFTCAACGVDLCKTCWLFFDGPEEDETVDLDPFPELIIEVDTEEDDAAFHDAFDAGHKD